MLNEESKRRLRRAFQEGRLRILSVSPEGQQQWKRVLAVHRAEVGQESIWEALTEHGPMVLTGGHRVFVSPTEKTEMENLRSGQKVLGVLADQVGAPTLLALRRVEDRKFMYDLTAEDWHNFVLHKSKVVVSNSPDRNYHFRPPEQEGVIKKYNRVFGYIWEDYELLCYLQMGLDWFNSFPPETESIRTLNDLCARKPVWRTFILWAAAVHALFALSANWVADEFSYSIGGISLDIEKSSKYESLKNNAEQQLDKATEAKSRTVKFIRGLQQPKFGFGVRSAFGPAVGRGVLSPRSFV
jgi:hypothetical protein